MPARLCCAGRTWRAGSAWRRVLAEVVVPRHGITDRRRGIGRAWLFSATRTPLGGRASPRANFTVQRDRRRSKKTWRLDPDRPSGACPSPRTLNLDLLHWRRRTGRAWRRGGRLLSHDGGPTGKHLEVMLSHDAHYVVELPLQIFYFTLETCHLGLEHCDPKRCLIRSQVWRLRWANGS